MFDHGIFHKFSLIVVFNYVAEKNQALHILRERASIMLFKLSFFSSFIILGFSTGATNTVLDFKVTCNVSIGKTSFSRVNPLVVYFECDNMKQKVLVL